MRQHGSRRGVQDNKRPLQLGITLIAMVLSCASCTSLIHSKSDEPAKVEEAKPKRFVRDMARVWGMRPAPVEGIGLVTQLAKTGSDPPASPGRDMLLDDMRRRSVNQPTRILASPATSLVMVRTQLPPGVRKGQRLDVEILTPSNSATTSLRQGWLMPTRLQELAVLGNRLRQGRLMGMAEGAVLVDALLENDSDPRFETTGRILGGAVSGTSRSLGLALTTEHHSVRASTLVAAAVNARFHTYDRGTKRGVATPKRDNFIDLSIHRSYRKNLHRYVRVVQAVPVRETIQERMERVRQLEAQLLEGSGALAAAVDLEAVGTEAIPSLMNGLESNRPLVRFAAAEALAYLNEAAAVPVLLAAAREEPAFRYHALTALSSMTETEARDALAELMHTASDESRYGAFQALIDFNPRDPAAHGEVLADVMALHRIPSDAEPLVHIRRTERPEVVLFGKHFPLQTPLVVLAGNDVLVKSTGDNQLKVTRFSMGADDRSEYCINDLGELIRTIVKVEGSYTDVVAAINDAKQKGNLAARVKFDALPTPGREYQLNEAELVSEEEEAERVALETPDPASNHAAAE